MIFSNSPKVRLLACNEGAGPVAHAIAASSRRAPFGSVFGLFRSMGYRLLPKQRMKWETAKRNVWVPFEMEKGGEIFTKWVKNSVKPGKLQWSDGADVPRKIVIAYSVIRARYRAMREATKAAEAEKEAA